jgi:hypothetical protein
VTFSSPVVNPTSGQSSANSNNPSPAADALARAPISPSSSQTASEARPQGVNESRDASATEHTASGESDWILKAGLLAASSSTSFFHSIFGATGGGGEVVNDDHIVTSKISSGWPTRGQPHQSSVRRKSIHAADYVLPIRKVADSLIHLYMKHTYIQWIDRLSFMQWYEGLWTGDSQAEDSIEEQIYYATLNIIFALVYQTEPEHIAEDQGELAQTYFNRAKRLLQFDLLDFNRLDLLRALLLLTQWYQSVNNVRQCASLVRLCILMAHNLGLHVPERTQSLPNQRQREMARRVWHGCILMDRITAMISGQPLQISQDAARKTPLFVAIDDEYLGNGKVDGVQPAGEPPMSTFFLAFCQLHIILGDALEKAHGERHESGLVIDINHIMKVDENLGRFYKALPQHLRFENDNEYNSMYVGPTVHLHCRLIHIRIMLFRVFFLRAAERSKNPGSEPSQLFADAVTHQGLLKCVRAAQEILQLISTRIVVGDRGPRYIPQWWHTVTYVYTASTILIAAHIFPTVVEETTASSLTESIGQGFQILDHHTEYKKSAQRCKTALAVLCERHVNPNNGSLNKASNGTLGPAEAWSQDATQSLDAAQISADFGWDFTNPSDLFNGQGVESLLFSTNLFGQETYGWL